MKNIFLFLLFSGILLRFFVQFFFPVFGVDEISLGNNIKYSSFIELLYPLNFGQSSPPLFLWLQKIIISISPLYFWISIKILSFVFSVFGIILFFIFIKRYNYNYLFLLPFIIILFNPFIIDNSLALKQYTVDLFGIIFLLVYFEKPWFKIYNWLFFLFWSLMSNIGLFACVGYLIFDFIKYNSQFGYKAIYFSIRRNLLILISPIPYCLYFYWFMKQNGARELKDYMVAYWNDSFIPMNSNIFKYLLYTTHSLYIFILNSFEIWGCFLLTIMFSFFYFLYSNRNKVLFKKEITLLFCICFVHLVLNVFHLYPFSDRLFLYLAPLFVIVIASSLNSISKHYLIKKYFKKLYFFISIITISLYSFYFHPIDNDVFGLYKKLRNIESNNFYVTKETLKCVKNFNEFTDYRFGNNNHFLLFDYKLSKSRYIISRVAKKIKMNETASEEVMIQDLISKKRLKKIFFVNGFNIYLINN